jgi:predicted O-methyltransferase YrrM
VQRYRNIPNSFIQIDLSLYIHEQDITRFTLANQNRFPFDVSFLVDQLSIYPKAKGKLPSFTAVYALFTPRSYEQSSAEQIALFKSSLYTGSCLLDLSGGLGVDDWAFAKTFDRVDSIDIDDQLNKIVRENYRKLKVANITRVDADAYDFVRENMNRYDCVYLDADRRVQESRTYALADTEPNILNLKNDLFKITDKILLKVSPMLDIEALTKELKQVKQYWILSLKNEVKEILVELGKELGQQILIHAVDIDDEETKVFSGVREKGNEPRLSYGSAGHYFYEPSLALIKSGLASRYFVAHQINQLAINSVYGVSDFYKFDFFGRAFEVVFQGVFSKSKLSVYLKNNQIDKANIAKRNFRMEVSDIRKQFGIKDGGDEYLFFTEDAQKQKVFFHCRKVVSEPVIMAKQK